MVHLKEVLAHEPQAASVHGKPQLSTRPLFCYPHTIDPSLEGMTMNSELRRRTDEVLSRLTTLRDSL
jgi:hypothetical protein